MGIGIIRSKKMYGRNLGKEEGIELVRILKQFKFVQKGNFYSDKTMDSWYSIGKIGEKRRAWTCVMTMS